MPATARAIRFVILAAPRTGSNWLCTLLDSHPEVLCHHEIWNPAGLHLSLRARGKIDFGTVAERDRDPDAVLARIWRHRLGHKAVGFKLNRGQDERVFQRVLAEPRVRKVLLRRRNRIRTYVSEQIAERTGQWESYLGAAGAPASAPTHRPPFELRVDAAALRAHAALNERYYTALEAALRAAAQPCLTLTYELLSTAEERRRVLEFLSVAAHPEWLAAATYKQNPRPLRDLIANFAQLASALHGSDLEGDLSSPDP